MSEEMKTECRLDSRSETGTRAASPASQSMHSAPFVGLRNTLRSDVGNISPFIDQLMLFISTFRVQDEDNFEIELALREALVNAIIHGNRNDSQKRVYIDCRCATDGEVSITVEDEGNGFEHDAVPDPTSPENRLGSDGRGIYLIRTLMDDVYFEEGGSVVHMRKRANAASDTTRRAQ